MGQDDPGQGAREHQAAHEQAGWRRRLRPDVLPGGVLAGQAAQQTQPQDQHAGQADHAQGVGPHRQGAQQHRRSPHRGGAQDGAQRGRGTAAGAGVVVEGLDEQAGDSERPGQRPHDERHRVRGDRHARREQCDHPVPHGRVVGRRPLVQGRHAPEAGGVPHLADRLDGVEVEDDVEGLSRGAHRPHADQHPDGENEARRHQPGRHARIGAPGTGVVPRVIRGIGGAGPAPGESTTDGHQKTRGENRQSRDGHPSPWAPGPSDGRGRQLGGADDGAAQRQRGARRAPAPHAPQAGQEQPGDDQDRARQQDARNRVDHSPPPIVNRGAPVHLAASVARRPSRRSRSPGRSAGASSWYSGWSAWTMATSTGSPKW